MYGESRLAVDYGTLSTSALVTGADGAWAPLSMDGAEVISSAVAVAGDGSVLAGQRAWFTVNGAGGGVVAAPLRLGRDRATVGGVDVAVADLVAATLRLVADAARVHGPVTGVRLVVPAGWGPRRRTWLRQAASRAGLSQASVIDAPIAAAEHMTATGRLRALVGEFLLVVDLGAGSEATVLRRTSTGYEVLSTLDDPEAGGLAVDGLLLSHVAAAQAAIAAGPQPLAIETTPVPRTGVRGSEAVALAGVRAAKEALATVPAVTVAMPPPHPPTVLTAASLEATARPVWTRAAALAVEAVRAADLDPSQLSAALCIGGGAKNPAAAAAVGDTVGMAPLVPEDPARAALWGAAGAAPVVSEGGDWSWAAALALLRHVPVLLVAGLASMLLFAHFIQTVEPRNGTPQYPETYYYIIATWGELAVAALCALIACLTVGVTVAAFLADERGVPLTGPRVVAGLAGASLGAVAIAGAYSVLGSFLLSVGYGPFLRWTILPMLPVLAVLGVAAVVVRRYEAPVGGWLRWLAFPAWSVVLISVGMLLLTFTLNAARWPDIIVLLDIGTRVAAVPIGIGLAWAIVSRPLFRLLLGVPVTLFCLVIAGWRAAGLYAVMFALAVAAWLAVRIWSLIREHGTPRAHAH